MIKYKFDVLYVLKAHGYSQYRIRQESLLSASAVKALKENKPISFESLNTICKLLNMNVADIIEYVPD